MPRHACRRAPLLVFLLLAVQTFIASSIPYEQPGRIIKVLNVGEELEGETLLLRSGRRVYRLNGVKESAWYEVKISYPASIPASFTIKLVRDVTELGLGSNRRLLNTEKLIFKVDKKEWGDSEILVLVTVEPEGIVALPGVQERDFVIFNIVCDELALGIPHKAWWVVVAAVLCLIIASIIPKYLPPYLLPSERDLHSPDPACTKYS